MMLSDGTIRSRLTEPFRWESWQRLVIEPYRSQHVQPCSYDVHLAGPLKVYAGAHTDTRRDNAPWWKVLAPHLGDSLRLDYYPESGDPPTMAWVLQPERLYLAVLDEWIVVPEDVCGQINGVSSRARDGISLHQQAGVLDPGWQGRATLEITVTNPHTIVYVGQRIGQVTFTLLDQRCEAPYRGRYMGDLDARPALPDHEETGDGV